MYFEHIVGYAAEKDRIDGIVKIIDSGEKNLLKSTRSPLKIAIVGDLEIANLFLDYLISQISVPYIKLFKDEQLPSPNELSHYKVICINEAHDLGLSSLLLSPSAVLIAILDKKSSDFEKIMTEITIDEIIEIGNPGFEFRLNMLKDELDTRIGEIKDQTLNFVAEITEGWSVSKIHQLIKKILLKTLNQNKAALTCEDILNCGTFMELSTLSLGKM